MRVAQSSLQLASVHYAESYHEVSERLTMWSGRRPQALPAAAHDQVELSDAGKAQAAREGGDSDGGADPILGVLRQLVEMMTGRRIRVFDPSDLQRGVDSPDPPPDPNAAAPAQGQTEAGFGLEYERHEVREEREVSTFSAQGEIRTADGQVIKFELSLTMARAYREASSVSIQAGDAVRRKDPLIVNFGGTAAQLTGQKFGFDLDADGSAENVSLATGGSGFLALDRNANGRVDNGGELFGPTTGNGFAELSGLDSDQNGWIDEADPVYAQLRLWQVDANGASTLLGLKEANVGAISLATLGTPFAMKDAQNRLQADVRSSGIYAGDDGTVGTVQQIDLAV